MARLFSYGGDRGQDEYRSRRSLFLSTRQPGGICRERSILRSALARRSEEKRLRNEFRRPGGDGATRQVDLGLSWPFASGGQGIAPSGGGAVAPSSKRHGGASALLPASGKGD